MDEERKVEDARRELAGRAGGGRAWTWTVVGFAGLLLGYVVLIFVVQGSRLAGSAAVALLVAGFLLAGYAAWRALRGGPGRGGAGRGAA